MTTQEGQITILIAEDNPGDRTLLEKALKESNVHNWIFFAEDGQELINYMNEAVVYSDLHKASCVVLLDLKMPRLDGMETLRIIKSDVRFKRIPVIILTSSGLETDVSKAYQFGANSYFAKPSDYKGFLELAKMIKKYWLQKATLPG